MTVAKTYDQLDERLRGWIADRHIFFVATAPSGPGGHVNLSPKGHADTFTILDERTVAYLDLTGSGAETAAHLRDNGRITLMFCAFSGPPRILRLYGRGRLVMPGGDRWEELAARFPTRRGARAVVVALERIADFCGYAVPCYRYVGQRDLLEQWVQRRDDAAIAAYRTRRNRPSIDNLPACRWFPVTGRRVRVWRRAGGGSRPTNRCMRGRKPI
jgi:Pyridoxamine 5'-phosphate oxidase